MTIFDRYIASSLFKGWLLVLLVLTLVFGMFAFIEELDHTMGNYQVVDVLAFVLMTMPQRLIDLAPVVAMIGSLIALATMARNNELVIIWAAGVSRGRFMLSVAMPTLVLMASLWVVAEYVAAPLFQKAESARFVARNGNPNLQPGNGFWSKSGQRYFRVNELALGRIPQGINIYEFGPGGELEQTMHAEYAHIDRGRTWTLVDVTIKERDRGAKANKGAYRERHVDHLQIDGFWSQDELGSLSLSTAGMTLSGLYEYANYLSASGQSFEQYRHLFWQRITLPLAAAALVLLALPIGTGQISLRSNSFGLQMAIGAFAGIFFYLGSQVVYTAGMVLRYDPRLVAALPVVVILLSWLVLQRRLAQG